jgi:hypothetical protein
MLQKGPKIAGFTPVIDPEFDNMGGDLTLAQIRAPVLSLAQCCKSYHPFGGDPDLYIQNQRAHIADRHYRLEKLMFRLRRSRKNPNKRKRAQLILLNQRFLAAQLRKYPKFTFSKNAKCNSCVPYNGHHTPNYWATGQTDCW